VAVLTTSVFDFDQNDLDRFDRAEKKISGEVFVNRNEKDVPL
jgi:hypothetical protein